MPSESNVWDGVDILQDFALSLGTRSPGRAARRILSWLSDPQEPYRIQLTGEIKGTFTAASFRQQPDSGLYVKLSSTYTPIDDAAKWNDYGGWPAYQRCEGSRVGAIGFEAAPLTAAPGAARDPRPVSIPVYLNLCEGFAAIGSDTRSCPRDLNDQPTPVGTTLSITPLRKASWVNATLSNQRAVLEFSKDDSLPPAWQREVSISATGVISIPTPIVVNASDWYLLQSGASNTRLLLRWKATVAPQGQRPYTFDYALDVRSQLYVAAKCERHGRVLPSGEDGPEWCAPGQP